MSEQERHDASAALGSSRRRKAKRAAQRQWTQSDGQSHVSAVPDLETIASSDSGGSGSCDSPGRPHRTHLDHFTARLDDELDQYMLDLEARRMVLKVQEQGLAAFANSDYHEPVEHYVTFDDDTDDDPPAASDEYEKGLVTATKPFRREDTLKVNWDLLELRQYHETLEQERNVMKTTAKRRNPGPSRSPYWRSRNASANSQSDLGRLRRSTRPPMLGHDIDFPQSLSPEPAQFDVTHGPLRSSTCFLTEQMEASVRQLVSPNGMWGGLAQPTQYTRTQSGLWGGFCAGDETPSDTAESTTPDFAKAQDAGSGILHSYSVDLRNSLPTPDEDLPYKHTDHESSPRPIPARVRRSASDSDRSRAASPILSQPEISIDKATESNAELDAFIDAEYPDTFVTQVFNYLSLGYPSLARPFDSELSEVTHVPIAQLRTDDEIAASMARGYIRVGSDFESEGNAPSGAEFARWRALKLYIRDWARADLAALQQRRRGLESIAVADDGQPLHTSRLLGNPGELFGTAPRRGSWAW